jgi:hypothetical protein
MKSLYVLSIIVTLLVINVLGAPSKTTKIIRKAQLLATSANEG